MYIVKSIFLFLGLSILSTTVVWASTDIEKQATHKPTGPVSRNMLPVGPTAGDMDLSPFYKWEGPVPDKSGVVMKEEPLPKELIIPGAKEAVRILYSSTDKRWGSGQVPVSGTLYMPPGRPPSEGWPLLAWAHGTVGIADICAPSWTGFKPRDTAYLRRWLDAGFALVLTDYQGLGGPGPHPYLDWQVASYSVLDSIRAASAARPGKISNKVLIAGHSQGSGAALGAALFSTQYAPEINILAAIATGINVTFPDGPVALPVRNSANMFMSFATGGLRSDGPQIDDIVSPVGKQLLDTARRACTAEIQTLARELKVRSLAETLSISLDQLSAVRIQVTNMPMKFVGVPLLVGTGLADQTVEPMRQFAAVSALCKAGNAVLWRRYPGLSHDGVVNGSLEDSLAFARSRLEGQHAASNCSEISQPGPPGEPNPAAPFNAD
ncbi:secretory lipase [Neorhizobium sp. R1-B]|uniref:lipase family protein n=1 Tax=Neorhizobium sp. R1-B TaxID=2485162 RepID=UPI0010E31A77|nr:lipase family protein [Neorhizobium sp. R1-B]TDX79657.1 secretory lipase [Neorhizobium sp. R1-B]